jgi:hypothetical protein
MLEERPARKPPPHLQGRGRDPITSLADELRERGSNSARHAPEASQQKVASNDTQPRTIIVTMYPQGRRKWSENTSVAERDSPAEDDLTAFVEAAAYGVRESQEQAGSSIPGQASSSPAAHHPDRLLIHLSSEWRVVDDDLQYILQRRKGNSRSKATGWVRRSRCRTREALLRCIREYCGPVDKGALDQVRALPEWHVDR